MKKSIIFLINGLGIERQGSYSIAIDQCMPNLAKTKETSYYTSAVINSFEYRQAYEYFFIGDSYQKELEYIKSNFLETDLTTNKNFQLFKNQLTNAGKKIHIFVEPKGDRIIDEINDFIGKLELTTNKEIYLHLILPQQTLEEYTKLINIVNFIKYHLHQNTTLGFVIGRDFIKDELTKEDLDYARKMFFYCSCERWSDTEIKLKNLQQGQILPCNVPGFCATNSCTIEKDDTILFFNTKRTKYDKYIESIINNSKEVYKTEELQLNIYSLIQLDTKYDIKSFINNIEYNTSLAKTLEKVNKKALIISSNENIPLVNFLANGMNYINNPRIQFMNLDMNYLSNKENINQLLNQTDYDLIIIDNHMDVSKTINDLKAQLEKIDIPIGLIAEASENKHSLFITSLYGIKKELPLAPYNTEMVTIDYAMEIPLFFFDYTYPRSKYTLRPGETNDILNTAIKCLDETQNIPSLIVKKGLFNNIFK